MKSKRRSVEQIATQIDQAKRRQRPPPAVMREMQAKVLNDGVRNAARTRVDASVGGDHDADFHQNPAARRTRLHLDVEVRAHRLSGVFITSALLHPGLLPARCCG